jgi:hypothetical protein
VFVFALAFATSVLVWGEHFARQTRKTAKKYYNPVAYLRGWAASFSALYDPFFLRQYLCEFIGLVIELLR